VEFGLEAPHDFSHLLSFSVTSNRTKWDINRTKWDKNGQNRTNIPYTQCINSLHINFISKQQSKK